MKTRRLRSAVSLFFGLAVAAFAATATDHPPRPVKRVPPAYTEAMRQNRPKGEVIVDFIVDEKGVVAKATVQKSLTPDADQAALECVQKWTFEPAAKAGRPVKARMRMPVIFN